MSSSSLHKVYAIAEATYGTTPASGATAYVRNTSCTLATARESYTSEELTGDRIVPTVRMGSKQTGGDIGIEVAHSAHDQFYEAMMGGTWASNVVKTGPTRRSFSILRSMNGVTPEWQRYEGQEVNSFSATVPTSGIVTGSFGFMGKNQATGKGALTTGPRNNSEPMDGLNATITLQVSGSTKTGIFATELSFSAENGMEPRFAIGSDNVIAEATINRQIVTGQLTVYYETASVDLLNAFLQGAKASIECQLKDSDNKTLTFKFPAVRFTGGNTDSSGGAEIMMPLPFSAYYDTTTQSQFSITRSA